MKAARLSSSFRATKSLVFGFAELEGQGYNRTSARTSGRFLVALGQAGYEAMVSYWSGKFAKLVANRGPWMRTVVRVVRSSRYR